MGLRSATTFGVPPAWREEWRDRFRALESRRFRLFWTGHAISVVGTWMQSVALYWLMYRLTRSPLLLGLTGVAITLPVLLFTLLGGALADRVSRRRLVTVTQALNLTQSVLLALVVTLDPNPRPELLLALAFAGGIVNAFDLPARQSFISELVPPAHLTNAIALNSAVFNAARLLGPAIAGFVLVRAGEAGCFWWNAVSFVPLLWNLHRMGATPERAASRQTALAALRDGLAYAWGQERIRNLLVLMLLAGSLGFQYVVLLPIYADLILRSGARGYSLLVAAAGVGALTASFTLTARRERPALRRVLFTGLALFGAGLIAFSLSRTLWLSTMLSAFVGLGMILYAAGTNTLLQTAVRDEYRGRVMSLFTLALIGTSSIGSLLMGAIGQRFGAPAATRVAGVTCLLGAIWVAHRLRVLARREAAESLATAGDPRAS